MNEKRIVYLEIDSWIGTSIGATHFYGELKSNGKHIELKRCLTLHQARELQKKDWPVEAGDLFHGFDTKDEIISLAITTYKEHFPEADILIQGRSACAEPQMVL